MNTNYLKNASRKLGNFLEKALHVIAEHRPPQVGGRGTGDGRRKGGKRDLYDGGNLSLFVTAYHPVKPNNVS